MSDAAGHAVEQALSRVHVLRRLAPFAPVGHLAALGGILAIAAVPRFDRLGFGLYDDEVYSVEVAKRSLSGIATLVQRTDTHPPLSYFVLHFWMQAFGSSEVAVRSLAALWGVGTVFVVYLIGRRLWSSQVGLIASLLLALSQFNVMYAHNARMYTMMAFFAALSFFCLARLYQERTRTNAVLYVVASTFLIYTHVWGVFIVLSQSAAAIVLAAAGRLSVRLLWRWFALQCVLLLLWAPWLLTGFREQIRTTLNDRSRAYGNLAQYHAPGLHTIVNVAYEAANNHLLGLLFVVIAGGAAVVAMLRARARTRSSFGGIAEAATGDPGLVAIAAWYAVPLAIGVVASYAIVPVFLQRYAIATTLPVYLAVGVAIASLRSRPVAALVLVAVTAVSAWRVDTYVGSLGDFFRAPPQYVAQHAKPNDVVLYDMPAIVFDYYANRSDLLGSHIRTNQLNLSFIRLLHGRRDAVDPAIRNPYTQDSPQQDLKTIAAVSHYPRVWLVMGPQFPGQLREATAVARLRQAFGSPKLKTHVGDFDVFLFARPPSS